MYAYEDDPTAGPWSGERVDFRGVLRSMGAAGGKRGRRGRHGPGRHSGSGRGEFPFGGFGPGGRPWRGRKARRGDIRSAVLLLLSEEARNGYQIMQEVEERSGGLWSPSPGSVYPALQQLEDEGLIRAEEADGRKLFRLTDAGREEVDKRDPERPAPWDEIGGESGDRRMQLGLALRAVAAAAAQVIRTGNDGQMTRAQKILDDTRRELYRILAEDDEESSAERTD